MLSILLILINFMKIIHIINSLNRGGAEGNLYRLCKFHKEKYKSKLNITIITLIKNGFYEAKLRKLGVNIFSLNLKVIWSIIMLGHALDYSYTIHKFAQAPLLIEFCFSIPIY